MIQLSISDRKITLYGDIEAPCPIVWLNTFENEGEAVWNACRELCVPDFILAAIQIEDWNGDLSPWAAQKIYKNDSDFAGNSDKYLQELTTEIIPEVTKQFSVKPLYHAIAGYSLAGLFAVYSLYKTEWFSRAASASGSFWFPGFLDFAKSHEMQNKPDAVYFSLGDKESCTRNPIMSTVQDNTQALHEHLKSRHIRTIFELNPGNHFQESALRTAKGIQWMLLQDRKV